MKNAVALLLLFAASIVSACARACSSEPEVDYKEVRAIVDKHCVSCHSDQPTSPAFPIAPNGMELDTGEQMHQHAEKIRLRTVVDKSMPLLNKTGMTDQERDLLLRWIEAGAESTEERR